MQAHDIFFVWIRIGEASASWFVVFSSEMETIEKCFYHKMTTA